MSGRDGFARADIDTSLLDDPKIKALVRSVDMDDSSAARAIVLYVSVVLASWAHGERVPAVDAAPIWLNIGLVDVKSLVSLGLLDDDERIPNEAWETWYGPAQERRRIARAAGREGGLAKSRKRGSGRLAEARHPLAASRFVAAAVAEVEPPCSHPVPNQPATIVAGSGAAPGVAPEGTHADASEAASADGGARTGGADDASSFTDLMSAAGYNPPWKGSRR